MAVSQKALPASQSLFVKVNDPFYERVVTWTDCNVTLSSRDVPHVCHLNHLRGCVSFLPRVLDEILLTMAAVMRDPTACARAHCKANQLDNGVIISLEPTSVTKPTIHLTVVWAQGAFHVARNFQIRDKKKAWTGKDTIAWKLDILATIICSANLYRWRRA